MYAMTEFCKIMKMDYAIEGNFYKGVVKTSILISQYISRLIINKHIINKHGW